MTEKNRKKGESTNAKDNSNTPEYVDEWIGTIPEMSESNPSREILSARNNGDYGNPELENE